MRPASNQPHHLPASIPTPRKYSVCKPDSSHLHQIETYSTQYEDDLEEDLDQEDIMKNQTFYECTEGEEKIWRLFKSLDCSECGKMYNNKERKPHIVCANNHLLCKSCYTKIRQTSFLCPFCNVRMNSKNTSSHESIQLFLKIYNEIFEKQKCIIEEKRKRTYLDFEIPKNLKTLIVLLLIIVTPWIYDALKFVVCCVVDFEYRLVMFLYDQISELVHVLKIIIEDEFYVNLYTNEHGEYVYHGDDVTSHAFGMGPSSMNNSSSSTFTHSITQIFTDKHKAKIDLYMKVFYFIGYLWSKLSKVFHFLSETLRIFNYCLHFIILLVGVVQFPFIIPIILFRVQIFFPRKYRYRIGLYLDIVQQENVDYYIEPEDIERLSKGELYFLLIVRNYIQSVLKLYKSIEVDMKKRCEELEYKKRMRQLKKGNNQKDGTAGSTAAKVTKRFTF